MFIQVEDTPNPDTLKFIPGESVLPDGYEGINQFINADQAASSPLAEHIFTLDGIERVFYGANFIAVSKSSDKQWLLIKPRILGMIMEHFTHKAPLFKGNNANHPDGNGNGNDKDNAIASYSPDQQNIIAQIKELLDERVRPAVAMDGGDIVFDHFDFEQGILFLQMRGACAGCPSSTATLKHGVENMLRHFIPEVNRVEPVDSF